MPAQACPDGLVYFCMASIEAHLRAGSSGPSGSRPSLRTYLEQTGGVESDAKQESPLFVTWNKRSFAYDETDASGHQDDDEEEDEDDVSLRGCIGTFSPLPLEKGLRDYAITSAFRDTRFRPMTADELPFLQCGVSLLTPMTPADDPLDWILGRHGIHITFHHSGRRYSGTYLPEVAPAQGWSKEEAIESLIRKAGYRGKVNPGDDLWRSIQLQVYESVKAKKNWAQYQRWKASRGES